MAENNLHDKISVKRMIRDLNINVATIPEDKDYFVSNSDINRPGIQLAGFYEHFPKDRIQVIGKVEHTYLLSMSENKQREVLDKYFSYDIPAVIIARDEKPNEIFIETAKKYKRVVLTTDMPTTHFINKLAAYIDDLIAPCEVISGVLVDVDGIGILIKGESGIGKSETALELIRRGHRLIADDVVEIKKTCRQSSGRTCAGNYPKSYGNTRHRTYKHSPVVRYRCGKTVYGDRYGGVSGKFESCQIL